MVCRIPARCFFCFSCFSTRVALAGNIAGNARKSPPNAGPNCLASRPAITVMAPPKRKLTAYSCHLVLPKAEKSIDTFTAFTLGHLPQNQQPDANGKNQPNGKHGGRCGKRRPSKFHHQ